MPQDPSDPTSSKTTESNISLTSQEITHRLRSKSQPIRLFGESERERGLRLRALELIEEKGLEKGYGGNDFKKALEDVELRERDREKVQGGGPNSGLGRKKREEAELSGPLDLGLLKTDPDKLYPLIYFALKKALKDWEAFLGERPGALLGLTGLVFFGLFSLTRSFRTDKTLHTRKTSSCNASPICRVS